jgi:hypothetical protein
MGLGLSAGLGLGELTATGEMAAAGVADRAWGVAGAPQAATIRISATPACLMPVERTLYGPGYSAS